MRDKKLSEKNKHYYENYWKKTLNRVLVGFLILISYLPFWVIYGISDFVYILVRYVIRYRKKVVIENLSYAFPEKTEAEINKIVGKFYHHLCDLLLESIKLYSISEKRIKKHIQYKGTDLLNYYFEKGKSVIVLAMHHNNWEWCSSVQLHLNNPIRGNQAFEKFLLHSRERWGGASVPVHKTARAMIDLSRNERHNLLWLAADQTPQKSSHFWTLFLNREAPFFSGPEKIAKKTNHPVIFHRTKKIKRGYYEVEFSTLFENPEQVNEKDILLEYIERMEEYIKKEPEYYLWSHRRWKHSRPEGIELSK